MGFDGHLLDSLLLALTIGGTWAATARVVKTRTTDGVSLVSVVMNLLAVGTWVAYGAARGNDAQILTSAIAFAGTAIVLAVAHRNGELRLGATSGAIAGYLALSGLAASIVGLAGVALIGSILSTANKVPQARESWVNPGGIAVSVSGFAMGLGGATGWLLYGFLHHDVVIIGTSAIAALQAAFVLVRTVQGRREDEALPALALRAA